VTPRLRPRQRLTVLATAITGALVMTWLTSDARFGQALAGVLFAAGACAYVTWLGCQVLNDARRRALDRPTRRVDPRTVRVIGRRRWE
jgi:hypothetical protein